MSSSNRNKLWSAIRANLSLQGSRLYTGVPADTEELLDEASRAGEPTLICRDQRIASFAAAGWAVAEGRAAVLALQAGPSFENARAGILEANSIGLPMLVAVTTSRRGSAARGGFQAFELNKHMPEYFTWQVDVHDESTLRWAVQRAVQVSEGSRPGPVLLCIDPDLVVQSADVREFGSIAANSRPSDEHLDLAASKLLSSDKVVLIVGGGAARSGCSDEIFEIAEALDARVLVTASGRGAFSESSARFLGLAGLYMTAHGRSELHSADTVLILGSRMEETARMGFPSGQGPAIIRIDRDARVLETSTLEEFGLVGDVALTTRSLLSRLKAKPRNRSAVQLAPVAVSTPQANSSREETEAVGVTAESFWIALSQSFSVLTSRPGAVFQENGLADMWGYDASTFSVPEGWKVGAPGEQTVMGYGLGSTLGAALSGLSTVVVVGDGAFEQNLSWLVTASELDVDICVFVLRNRKFGWPSLSRVSQDPLTSLTSNRDIVGFASSCGFHAQRVESPADLPQVLDLALGTQGLRLVEVEVSGVEMSPGVAREIHGDVDE